MNNKHIIFSYLFDGKGGGTPLKGSAITRKIKSKELAWVHMDAEHIETEKWLHSHLSYLDPFIIDALLANETRPRMTQIGNGAIVILRGVNLNEGQNPEDMISVRMWIDPHRIVTVKRRNIRAILDIESSLKYGTGPKNSGEFLCTLLDCLFKSALPILNMLDDKTDEIEQEILEGKKDNLRDEIVMVRKRSIMFRRYMYPQRDAIGSLKLSNLKWIDEENKRFLQEAYNQLTIHIEDLDAIRERSQLIKDELVNMMAMQLNKNTYILSVFAAVFLPLSFLTGLLGTNFHSLPGGESSNGFWIFCLLLLIVVVFEILLFKKLKWF